MPDLYLTVADQSEEFFDAVAQSMNHRASDPRMREICARYMGKLPKGCSILEIGCGNGASTSLILEYAGPSRLVGVDPSQGLIDQATPALAGDSRIEFVVGDAAASGQEDESFDIVIAHTVFSHLAEPEAALAEAFRVLTPGGMLAVFDGDYATNTVALFDGDPLQAAMVQVQRNLIHDCYVMRRMPRLVLEAGFAVRDVEAHGYVKTAEADYIASLLDRGAAAAIQAGEIGSSLAEGFSGEAERRIEQGSFFGSIQFISLIAKKT